MSEDVTQADRQRAALLVLADGNQRARAKLILAGSSDEGPTVQSFKDHRIAAAKAMQEACRRLVRDMTCPENGPPESPQTVILGYEICAAIRALNQEETP